MTMIAISQPPGGGSVPQPRQSAVTDQGGLCSAGRSGGRPPRATTQGAPESYRAGPHGCLLATVVATAARAPSVHNTQPWRFRIDGDVDRAARRSGPDPDADRSGGPGADDQLRRRAVRAAAWLAPPWLPARGGAVAGPGAAVAGRACLAGRARGRERGRGRTARRRSASAYPPGTLHAGRGVAATARCARRRTRRPKAASSGSSSSPNWSATWLRWSTWRPPSRMPAPRSAPRPAAGCGPRGSPARDGVPARAVGVVGETGAPRFRQRDFGVTGTVTTPTDGRR